MGCHFLLEGIFPTWGSNPHLLQWQAGSVPLSCQGSPDGALFRSEKGWSAEMGPSRGGSRVVLCRVKGAERHRSYDPIHSTCPGQGSPWRQSRLAVARAAVRPVGVGFLTGKKFLLKLPLARAAQPGA